MNYKRKRDAAKKAVPNTQHIQPKEEKKVEVKEEKDLKKSKNK